MTLSVFLRFLLVEAWIAVRVGLVVALAMYGMGLLPYLPLLPFVPLNLGAVLLLIVTLLWGLRLLQWKSWRLYAGVFSWYTVGCASYVALHYFVLSRLVWLRFNEPPGYDTIGPISVCGIPFPCFISAPGYSVMSNIAGCSFVAFVGNCLLFCGGLALLVSRYIPADAKRIALRIFTWGVVLGVVGTIRLFVMNWQSGGSVSLVLNAPNAHTWQSRFLI